MTFSANLDGTTILVTGASSGLGAHFTHVLAKAGAHVIATARRRDLLETLVRGIPNATAEILDVTDPVSVKHALARLGPDRAIGRVEGGAAILVEMKVLGRESAHEKTHAFKVMARSYPRAKWMDKIFKSGDVDE